MEAGKRDITTIFNRARTLEIPFFQRSFVWEKENWERFADDLIAASQRPAGYFLGSLILKQKDTGTGSAIGDVRVVVDGQQRLTSLVLFFRALCDATNQPEIFNNIFINLRGRLILQHNHNDIRIFEALAHGHDASLELQAEFRTNRVLGAFKYFAGRTRQLANLDPLNLIERLYFVGIDLGRDEDEQQIFDTINSLGVDLTTAELLKNELYDRSDIDLFNHTWRSSFENSETQKNYWSLPVTSGRERRQNADLFLQAYLLNQPGVPDDVRVGNLFSEYRRHLRTRIMDRRELIDDLTASADLYRKHVDPQLLDQAIDSNNAYERLNLVIFGLQTTTILPYFLHILRSSIGAEECRRMLRLLETYVMRRLICGETTARYNRFFAALARGGVDSYDQLTERLMRSEDPTAYLPSDEAVIEGFQRTNLTNSQARVLLYLIECSIRDESRHSTALASFRHYTLEHIMPKNWPSKWGTLPDEQAQRRNGLVRKIGNLTLLSARLNNSIRDADWITKKGGTGQRAGLKRYAVGLDIFDQDLHEETWTEDHIQARGERLARYALSAALWPIPT